jgi:hypothetical protein
MQPEPSPTHVAAGIAYQSRFTWPPRGFEVDLAGWDKVRLGHLRYEGWLALVSESDIRFS